MDRVKKEIDEYRLKTAIGDFRRTVYEQLKDLFYTCGTGWASNRGHSILSNRVIGYAEDLGYIKILEDPDRKIFFRLTADGVDFLERGNL